MGKIKRQFKKLIDFCFGVKCYECGKRGYWARKCWTPKGNHCFDCLVKNLKEQL